MPQTLAATPTGTLTVIGAVTLLSAEIWSLFKTFQDVDVLDVDGDKAVSAAGVDLGEGRGGDCRDGGSDHDLTHYTSPFIFVNWARKCASPFFRLGLDGPVLNAARAIRAQGVRQSEPEAGQDVSGAGHDDGETSQTSRAYARVRERRDVATCVKLEGMRGAHRGG